MAERWQWTRTQGQMPQEVAAISHLCESFPGSLIMPLSWCGRLGLSKDVIYKLLTWERISLSPSPGLDLQDWKDLLCAANSADSWLDTHKPTSFSL